ncbi:MAG: DNA repair protein RecN [Bryobacterales bacterium]|nr:DNA repair protein RecN [Bryobacterales bacterium]
MLHELTVENYAVIGHLRLGFGEGLNLLTGETGSGKSIVVDALGLLFGGRSSADIVRSGADRARVAGIFSLRDGVALPGGVGTEDGEILIEREVLASGKSRAYVNNRPVTAGLLRELGVLLGDIHGQHDQQALFDPAAQLAMLDAFAGLSEPLAAEYGKWSRLQEEIAELERNDQEKLRLLDLWTFQRSEIERVAPKSGEDAALEAERRLLLNLARVQENAAAAFGALYEGDGAAFPSLRAAMRRIEDLARIDPSLSPLTDALLPASIAIEEAAFTLRDYLSKLEASPGRIDDVEERLSALDLLKRKYGPTLDDAIAYGEKVKTDIATLETAGERLEALRRELAGAALLFEEKAAAVSAARRAAGDKLASRVAAELRPLAMERTVFRVEMTPAAWSAQGADAVRFLVSANLGEEPRPLDRVASGGEMSRIALALKTCLAAQGGRRTLVFDEVDAGVGGRAAEGIGRRLRALAAQDQVLCVTHLPQVAGFAHHHYRVEKRESGGRTEATVVPLDRAGRVEELARMLSGATLTPEARRNAERLLVE